MDKETERYIQLIKNAQTEYSEDYFTVAVPGFMSKKFIAYCAELVVLNLKGISEKKYLKIVTEAREITSHFQTILIINTK